MNKIFERYKTSTAPDERVKDRICKKCGSVGNYRLKKNKNGNYIIVYCIPCMLAKRRAYTKTEAGKRSISIWSKKRRETHPQEHKIRIKKSRLKTRYGMSIQDYDDMVKEQNGVCAICFNPPKKFDLHVDHDHSNGKVRKLLCQKCNVALGLVNDDITVLNNMVDYIRKHKNEC